MGSINPEIPTLGQPNATEDADTANALQELVDLVNGELDTTNLSDSAGIKLTQLASEVPSQIGATSTPTGCILPFAGDVAPAGFKICNGAALSRSTFANLWNVIQTKYGAGNGSTTFNIPDMQGRTLVGLGTNGNVNALGKNEGFDSANIVSRTPHHFHTMPTHHHGIFINTGGNGSFQTIGGAGPAPNVNMPAPGHVHLVAGNTDSPTMPNSNNGTAAFIVINYVIKT